MAQEFLSKCKAPDDVDQEVNLAQGRVPHQPYLSMPSKLPELKEREGFVRPLYALLQVMQDVFDNSVVVRSSLRSEDGTR